MIGYVTLGTENLEQATRFFDQLLATVGVSRLWSHGSMAAWGSSRSDPALCIAIPFDGNSATTGNGVMVALKVASREEVAALHAKAIELGGTDEGPPGPRGDHGFYGAYFRDLDGNKLSAYVPAPPPPKPPPKSPPK